MLGEKKTVKFVSAFTADDYAYRATGEPVQSIDEIKDTGVLYEIVCNCCGTSIRSQGINTKDMLNGNLKSDGCAVCGKKEFSVKAVDMSKYEKSTD